MKLAAVLALAVVAALAWWLLRPEPPAARQSVAVLPFDNLTGDSALDYLGQGLSAGLLTQLGEASGVRVLGRATLWSGRGSPVQIASRLGVGSLLEGSIQRHGEGLLVDVQLTDTRTHLVLWNERFEGDHDSLISLQQEIGRRLVSVLSVPLSPRELDRMARDPTRSFEAYEYFMRGFRELEIAPDANGAKAAAALFQQAVRLDGEFALAHVGLSESLWRQGQLGHSSEFLTGAEEAARRALEIDPDLPAAQVALARVYRSRGRSGDSIAELQEALASHPKPDEALRELAVSYEQTGDLESAEESLRAADALRDDWFTSNLLGVFLARHGNYDEARLAFERATVSAGELSTQPRENLATLDLSQGRFDRAIEAYEQLPKPIRHARLASNIGTAYYYSNHPDKWQRAEEYYRLAVELAPRRDLYRGNLADLYLEHGRDQEARKSYRMAWALVEEQLEANPEEPGLLLRRAIYEAKAGECSEAVPHAAALVLAAPQTGPKAYQLAKVFAMCDRRTAALDALRLARRLGESGEVMRRDSEFSALADDPEFLAVVGEP
jgi:TolB-like protein/Flp pilus assembly protein TadD